VPASRKFQRHAAAHIPRSPGNKNLSNGRNHLDDSITIISIDAKVAQALLPVHAASPIAKDPYNMDTQGRSLLLAGRTSFLPEKKA